MKNDFGQFSDRLLELAHEMWEYRTCQRVDGSYYGTAGQCRKGTETTKPEKEKKIKKAKSEPKEPQMPRKAKLEEKKIETEEGQKDAKYRQKKQDEKLDYGYLSFENPPKAEISSKAKETLLDYTADQSNSLQGQKGFEAMNGCSRNPPSCNSAQKKANADMDEALRELPRNEGANTANGISPDKYHRGISVTENPDLARQLSSLKPGDQMVDDGFGSYSRNLEIAKGFTSGANVPNERNVIITSTSREIRNIEHYSDFEEEKEGVLPRGTSQTVRKVEFIGNTTYIEVD